jgi:hypothetical protein
VTYFPALHDALANADGNAVVRFGSWLHTRYRRHWSAVRHGEIRGAAAGLAGMAIVTAGVSAAGTGEKEKRKPDAKRKAEANELSECLRKLGRERSRPA